MRRLRNELGSQLGGPDPSSTVAECESPDESVHSTFTLSPGWYGTIRCVSPDAELTELPSTLVIAR